MSDRGGSPVVPQPEPGRTLAEQLRDEAEGDGCRWPARCVPSPKHAAVMRAAADRLDALEAVADAARELRVFMRANDIRIVSAARSARVAGLVADDPDDLDVMNGAKDRADALTAALAALDPSEDPNG